MFKIEFFDFNDTFRGCLMNLFFVFVFVDLLFFFHFVRTCYHLLSYSNPHFIYLHINFASFLKFYVTIDIEVT